MKVLSVASEVFPLVKTGGLADVAGALPGALAPLGIEMRTLLPGYPAVLRAVDDATVLHAWPHWFGGPARLVAARHAALDLIVLDAPHLYARGGNPYVASDGHDWPDNAERFAALSAAAAFIGLDGVGGVDGFAPDLFHAHDWQAALVPAYLRDAAPRPATVLTVHNLAFQGRFPATVFGRLGLPGRAFASDGVEYFGDVGFLKAGILMADAVTTVSPGYAREIRTPAAGMGLDPLLRWRGAAVSGIVNGIDTTIWDPANDAALVATYDAATLERRVANKRAVEARFGLGGRRRAAPLHDHAADRTEGHRPRRRGARRDRRRRRATGRPRERRRGTRGGAGRRRRALAGTRRSAGSATTRRCRTCCRGAATRSSCRAASSPAASRSCTACATAACRWWRASADSRTR